MIRADRAQDCRCHASRLCEPRLPCPTRPVVRPPDLVQHSCLTISRNPGSATWLFRVNRKPVRVDVKGPISADSADTLLKLAIEGRGILRLSEHVVAGSIKE